MDATATLRDEMTKLAARVNDLRKQKAYLDQEIAEATDALRAMELAFKYISRAAASAPGPSFSFMQTVPAKATDEIVAAFDKALKKSDIMRDAMARLGDRFTNKDLFEAIPDDMKAAADISINDVSFFLSRIKKSGKLFIAEQGAGKTPSTYSKTDPAFAA